VSVTNANDNHLSPTPFSTPFSLPHQILHVAQSLTHDMVPATQMGMSKVWINRRHNVEGLGATAPPQGDYTIEWEFNGMTDFAIAHQPEIA